MQVMPLKFIVSAAIAFIGITLALGYFGLSTSISGFATAPKTTTATTTATSTTLIEEIPNAEPLPTVDPERPGIELPKIVFPKIPLPKESPLLPPKVTPPAITETPKPITPVIPSSETEESEEKSETPQSAFVNIVCAPDDSELKKSISGSGVIIDSRGIILTVAHVGHYFLLEDYPERGNADCTIRTGSPAKTAYDAKLIYVSPAWVEANAGVLAESSARGNGQNDFAILAITRSLTSAKLPSSFPFISLSSESISAGDDVSIGSYGAEFLTGSQIRSALYPIFDEGEIEHIYTYGQNKADVVSVRGSDAAQSGSSGGGIVNDDGEFIGLISTSSLVGGTAQRTLYAITPNHIRSSFKADTGATLDAYLRQNLATLISNFEDEQEDLAELVWEALF